MARAAQIPAGWSFRIMADPDSPSGWMMWVFDADQAQVNVAGLERFDYVDADGNSTLDDPRWHDPDYRVPQDEAFARAAAVTAKIAAETAWLTATR